MVVRISVSSERDALRVHSRMESPPYKGLLEGFARSDFGRVLPESLGASFKKTRYTERVIFDETLLYLNLDEAAARVLDGGGGSLSCELELARRIRAALEACGGAASDWGSVSFGVALGGLLRAEASALVDELEEAELIATMEWLSSTLRSNAGDKAEGDDDAALVSMLKDARDVNSSTQAIEALARYLEGFNEHEIERKYLLSALPPRVRWAKYETLSQGYLPGVRLHERLRKVDGEGKARFFRTIKIGSGVKRVEVEEEIDKKLFGKMWSLTKGRRLKKRRYTIDDGGFEWVIDEFRDRPLVLAEVELPSERIRPPFPEWLAPFIVRDVTDEREFLNARLAR